MTPVERMAARTAKLSLVIFDCDGVLVDSEPLTNRFTAEEFSALGWAMTPEQSNDYFLGMNFADMAPLLERHIGRSLPAGWQDGFVARLIERLGREVTAIPGALEVLRGLDAAGIAWRVGSNSSHPEMAVKFRRLGMSDMVAGRLHSFTDVARGKPAPDLFLAAAAAQGVPPAECVVVEDSVTGTRAAIAAGMDCLGFAPHGDGAALAAAGAVVFHAMAELPAILAAAPR